jgi:hypothetical protein
MCGDRFDFQMPQSIVIASDSEAVQDNKEELDCFVANAPRKVAKASSALLQPRGAQTHELLIAMVAANAAFMHPNSHRKSPNK